MRGRWERLRIFGHDFRVCPDCSAVVWGGANGQEIHYLAHNPEPEEPIYEYADGVKVGRPPGALRQIRDIFRLKPPAPEPVKWTAEQELEDRGQRFRAAMESINGQGSGHAAHDNEPV